MHDVVGVTLEHLGAGKASVPIPQLGEHVVGAGDEVREGGVDGDGAVFFFW